jgi:predicted dehydrogenase
MLKLGIIGTGHLGKIHIKCAKLVDHIDLIGFYDKDREMAAKVEAEHGIKAYDSLDALLAAVDAVDIVTPTLFHHRVAMQALSAGKHVFVEKPITHTVPEAKELVDLGKIKGLKIQVGHVERFNPAFLALRDLKPDPKFIESHRLATFNPRGTDVSVVLDLMIHDLDIILSIVDSDIKQVHASGVSVVSDTPDISNARIEFENGCVANLTASRLSMKQMRKMRIFRKDAYISVDFFEKETQIIQLHDQPEGHNIAMEIDTQSGTKFISMSMPEVLEINAIKEELSAFASSILNNTDVVVSGEDGYKALKLAHEIIAAISQDKIA